MTLTIVGHGYVGLVSACVFADFGNEVYVIGRSTEKINRLKNGDPIIFEPGLKELLEKNLKAGRLHFTLDYQEAIPKSEIVFITVGTPPKSSHFTVVSCKSTVPVGTNKKVEEIIKKYAPKKAQFAVASCPEFLREGSAIADTLNADRIVIGSSSKKAIEILLKLHQPFSSKKIVTDLASAELIKYAANAILATKISFSNLMAFYCEKTGADVEKVLDAVGLDKRIGRIFMNPGVGYGGSCLPKDVLALIDTGKKLNIDTSLLEAVDKVNYQAKKNFLQKILKKKQGKNTAILGLSFKPNTDDIRFAPSIFIIENLLKHGFKIKVFDPEAMGNIKKIFGEKIEYAKNPYEAAKEADQLIILTEWNEFKQIDLKKLKKILKKPVIFDGRNIYDPLILKNLGFKYFSVGR